MKINWFCLMKRLPVLVLLILIFSVSGVFAVWQYSTLNSIEDEKPFNVVLAFPMPNAWQQQLSSDQVANVNAFASQASNKTSPLYDVVSWRKNGAFGVPGNFTYVGSMGSNKKMDDFKEAYNLQNSSIIVDFSVEPMILYITNEKLSNYSKGDTIPNIFKVTFVLDEVGNYVVSTVTKGSAPWMAYDQSNYIPTKTYPCFNYKQWQAY